jgi:hypothetical protein
MAAIPAGIGIAAIAGAARSPAATWPAREHGRMILRHPAGFTETSWFVGGH